MCRNIFLYARVGSQAARCLLNGLWASGVNHCSHLRLQRWASPITTSGPRTGTTCGPSQPSTIHCCFPGNKHALQLPLPKALGTAYSCLKVTATSQGPATKSSLCHFRAGLSIQVPAMDLPMLPFPGKQPQAIHQHNPFQGDNSLHTLRKRYSKHPNQKQFLQGSS